MNWCLKPLYRNKTNLLLSVRLKVLTGIREGQPRRACGDETSVTRKGIESGCRSRNLPVVSNKTHSKPEGMWVYRKGTVGSSFRKGGEDVTLLYKKSILIFLLHQTHRLLDLLHRVCPLHLFFDSLPTHHFRSVKIQRILFIFFLLFFSFFSHTLLCIHNLSI